MRREYTTRIIVRCTPEERARWKALAQRLEAQRRQGQDRRWHHPREEMTLSSLVRQLLEERRLNATPALPAVAAIRRRRAPAAS